MIASAPGWRAGSNVGCEFGKGNAGMNSFSGKVAICFGGARGIGARTAERLAAGGARVVIADIARDLAHAVSETIRSAGGEAVTVPCDISSEQQVASVVAEATTRYGGIDLVHQNVADAGLAAIDGDIIDTDIALFDKTMAVNLRGSLICTRLTVPELLKRGGGAIVFTSTDGVYTQGKYQYFYRMSKAGLNSLMRSVAHRYGGGRRARQCRLSGANPCRRWRSYDARRGEAGLSRSDEQHAARSSNRCRGHGRVSVIR